jgi:UDPglucose 6-dehydrogenase
LKQFYPISNNTFELYFMKIAVIGSGYVGLVTGTCFAETGVNVTCVDNNEKKISNLKNGIIPIYEPGLDNMIERNVEKGRLEFTTDIRDGLVDCEVVFIAVGTPPDDDGSADLQYVLSVARDIGRHLNNYMVVVNKSTVPIGTAVKVRDVILQELSTRKVNISFDVASNPEFLKEGSAIEDFLKPDRIVVGIDSEEAKKYMERLYKPFLLNNHPIIYMDIPSAELTKYAANAMLATRISFMNEMANLCEKVGADVNAVRRGIGSDPRIGSKFIYPGAGYGGSCFPKDVKALIKMGEEYKFPLKVMTAVDEVNNYQKSILFKKIRKYFSGNLAGKKIAIWGLSFKPNTDDMREAPALTLIRELLKEGVSVAAYDPVAMKEAKRRLGNSVLFAEEQYEAVKDADALAVVTEWTEFRILNFGLLKTQMRGNVVFDGRNIYDPLEMKEKGFDYYGIGRKIFV